MASFLVRALGYPISGEDYFTDDNGNTHEDNINTLRANNVTLGCNPEGTLYLPERQRAPRPHGCLPPPGPGLATLV